MLVFYMSVESRFGEITLLAFASELIFILGVRLAFLWCLGRGFGFWLGFS